MAYEERFADVLSAVDLAIQASMGSARPLCRVQSDPTSINRGNAICAELEGLGQSCIVRRIDAPCG